MHAFLYNYHTVVTLLFIAFLLLMLVTYPLFYRKDIKPFNVIMVFMTIPLILLAIPGKGYTKRLDAIANRLNGWMPTVGIILWFTPFYITFLYYGSMFINEESFYAIVLFKKVSFMLIK